ncbi:MAG: hypothetical protein COT73_09315 [Bdellovibrio sp. CG10_big_fil_rev_8_21_14_0_10_47_8]|nr:MAG: hypothetical protein COT73_09315 [Bdellovibrio sp. CG10_big_fil_rev_8_21_14_0_10_47_8]
MKKKNRKPKEKLVASVLEDLKSEVTNPTAPAHPVKVEGDPMDSEKTTLLQADNNAEANEPKTEEPATRTLFSPAAEAPPTRAQLKLAAEPKHSQNYSSGKATSYEGQFLHAENLKVAQQRLIEMEKDLERLRRDNEILSSAGDLARQKTDDLLSRIQVLEQQRHELKESSESELRIFREGLTVKDNEIQRLRGRVSELEARLANDLRKIRVREKELENRLELSKLEKAALLRSKDETILDLKRKTDSLTNEIETYQGRLIELNQEIESNQEQFRRTVRALRIALTNLEVNENTSSITIAPLKKAE